MNRLTIAERMRTGHVRRWQIVRVAKDQSVAEHSYRVWLLIKRLLEVADTYGVHLDQWDRSMACQWALMHDLPEVKTGDLATPIKRAMREAVPHSDPIRRIELSLDDEYRDLYLSIKNGRPWILALVKAADLMEAIDFLQTEGLGRHAIDVQVGLSDALSRIWAELRPHSIHWQQIINQVREELTR